MLTFKFRESAYVGRMQYRRKVINAVIDSGASRSTTSVNGLASILGVDPDLLNMKLQEYSNSGISTGAVYTASGRLDRTIEVMLPSVILAGHYFLEFYFAVNLDNYISSAEIGQLGDAIGAYNNIILIGLDVLRSGTFDGNDSYFYVHMKNNSKYIEMAKEKFQKKVPRDVLMAYIDGDVAIREFTEQDLESNYINQQIKGTAYDKERR